MNQGVCADFNLADRFPEFGQFTQIIGGTALPAEPLRRLPRRYMY